MEKAGRRRLASAAPPLRRLRRRESGADEGGQDVRPELAAPRSLVRSGPDNAPRSGADRPGSGVCCRRISLPLRARLRWAGHQRRTEPSWGRGCSAPSARDQQPQMTELINHAADTLHT